jgi:hypothetical protein
MSVSELFSQDTRTIAPNHYDTASAPFSLYLQNPATAPLDLATYDLVNGGTASFSAVSTEQLGLPAGSLQTAVEMTDPLQCSLSRSGIAQITPGSSQVTVPFAGVSNASVIIATYHLDSGVLMDATATTVEAVETGVDNFIIHLNANATASVKVAWLVAKL